MARFCAFPSLNKTLKTTTSPNSLFPLRWLDLDLGHVRGQKNRKNISRGGRGRAQKRGSATAKKKRGIEIARVAGQLKFLYLEFWKSN